MLHLRAGSGASMEGRKRAPAASGWLASRGAGAEPGAEMLTLRRRLHMAIQGAKALRHVHHCRFLHRDVKSPNFFVDGDRNLLLGDFGLTASLVALQHRGDEEGMLGT